VDPGDTWNTSQVWSSTITYGGSYYSKLRDAFDGSTTSATYDPSFTNNNDSILWDSSSYSLTGTLELYTGDGSLPIEVNGVSVGTGNSGGGWKSFGNFAGINSIKVGPVIGFKAAILNAVRINGSILVDADHNVYSTLFEPISQQAGFGTLFYDANQGEPQTALQLANRYGLPSSADITRGIYALSEQPSYPVSHYTKIGNVYVPHRDYQPSFDSVVNALKEASSVWASSTAYTENQLILHNGVVYRVITAFTSGSTFSEANLSELT
jgi:hypothetical protein